MSFHLPGLLTSIPGGTYSVLGFVAAIVVAAKLYQRPRLDAIPAVGPSTWPASWLSGFQYLTSAQSFIQQGYEKESPSYLTGYCSKLTVSQYKSAPFKVSEPHRWKVIISSREHIEEVVKATDAFSFVEAVNDDIQVEHLFAQRIHQNPYHVTVVRLHLTRNLDVACPLMRDEITTSFAELLDLKDNEWKGLAAMSVIEQVVCRATNRVFIGLPLSRDPDWIDLNIRCTTDVIKGGVVIGLFPKFMRTLAGRIFTQVPRCIERGMRLLRPIIEERQKCINEYGTEWDDKPSDLLTWLMDEGESSDLTVQDLTSRILLINVAAVHSISDGLTKSLFRLAMNPQYIQPLREEIGAVVENDGWSKISLGKMRKVDSFLRELMRVEGTSATSLSRKALKDYTFADGTFIPKGTIIAAASYPIQHDKKFYANPEVFDPLRFADMREDGGGGPKTQVTSTSTEYLPFGHGRNACPGRFLAANVMKLILAHIIVTYDMKLEDGAPLPKSWRMAGYSVPDLHAKVMFRNRVDRV